MIRRMKTAILAGLALVGFMGVVAASAKAESVRAGSSTAAGRDRGAIVADVRVAKETAVRSQIAMIERVTGDGEWLMASAAGVPLLDRWRGEETGAASRAPAEMRVASELARAGIEPTETMVRILMRRIERYPMLRDWEARSVIARDAEGEWRVKDAGEEGAVRATVARLILEAENADRRAILAELERQASAPPSEAKIK